MLRGIAIMAIPSEADFTIPRDPNGADRRIIPERPPVEPPLDFAPSNPKKTPMRALFVTLICLLGLARMHAAILELDGDLTWNVTEPRCSFRLDGAIRNAGPNTGTLKLVLWATPNPFPSPGYIVGEYTLGSLPSGYQITDFTVKTKSKLPVANGKYYFTVVVVEYTTGGWKNVLAEPGGNQRITGGDIYGQKKWTIPTKTVLPPIGKLSTGMLFTLKLKATGEMNFFPTTYQEKTSITIKSSSKLETKLHSKKKTGSYSLKVQSGKLNNKNVTYSQLAIDYGSGSETTISLYFQGPYSGTYKSVETTSSGTETTWGGFTLQ
jgi:hypothetical protein